MLKQNDEARREVNAEVWHAAGYTGKGVTIVLLDGTGIARDNMKSYYTDVLGHQKEIGHATNVGTVAHEFAPDAKILMFSNTHDRGEAFEWIREHKNEIDLINVSLAGLGGMPTPEYLHYEALGIPLICASGNDDYEDRISYPAAYPFTIAVGAWSWKQDVVEGFSNEGPALDCVAPDNIYMQRDDGYTWSVSGTSFASPAAAGMLACYLQYRKENGLPKLTPEEIRSFIHKNCTHSERRDTASGYGLFCLPKTIPVAVEKGDDTMQIRPCDITMADYHHTVGYYASADAIRKEHMGPPNKWGDIGYNMVILQDGTIEWGRDTYYSGAHDSGPASDGSEYTMNQRAFGIACVGNFETSQMSEVQYQGLLKGAKIVRDRYGLGIDDHHKHSQQYDTKCPGKFFPWNRLISDLENDEKGEDEMKLEHAVVYFTDTDFSSARIISRKLGGCAMYCRDGVNSNIHKDIENCEHPVVVGGAELNIPGATNCCGLHAEDTAIEAAQYAKTL